ncbi:MAG: helix-turn-helix transcriptional regulator, partial [Alphaproteobacteria bacterium]|nr:helix-turn-helix transcriptional regulator [Alphaproteobacteria bacterium]
VASRHAYGRHSHEGYALGIVEAGAHGFIARWRRWVAAPGCSVIIVNPEEVHDGGPAGPGGAYSYRMLYLPAPLLAAAAAEIAGRRSEAQDHAGAGYPFFPAPVVADPDLARLVHRLHAACAEPSAPVLERESRLLGVLGRLILAHAAMPPLPSPHHRPQRKIVARVRDYLDANLAEPVRLADLAAVAGVSRFHLLRLFRRELGLPPHAWLMQRRLRRAKALLGDGEAPAAVAAALGFVDQSHLTRCFRASFGITPGAYRRGLSNRVQ